MLLRDGRTPEPVDLRVRDGVVLEVAGRLEPEQGERVVELRGRFVRRGLRDAHAHVVEAARAAREVDLTGTRSASEVAQRVGAAAAAGTGELRGVGFREPDWPDAADPDLLQRAAPDRVVVLRSLDMHSAWLSRPALRLVGLPDHPDGLLREHEAWDALSRLPAPDPSQDDDAVAALVARAHARGLTAVRDFSFEDALPTWQRRRDDAGRLPLRVVAVVLPERLPGHVSRGERTGEGDAWLRVGPLKLFADGALGAQTARCLHPYAGSSDRGQQLLGPDALREALHGAARVGFDVAVHAIGDEATRDALHALQHFPGRASVEHAQLLRREDLPLFAAGRVTASVQPAHLLDDAPLVDRLWTGTPSVPFALRSLVAAGARVVLGSDAPVSPLDPWRGLAAAVHRAVGEGPPWRPEEAVDLETALALSGARRPRTGDPADLVVLDLPDPGVLGPADLAAVPVHATWVGGTCVHGPERDA